MTSNTNQTDCTKCVQLHKLTNENDDLKERVKKLENLLDEKSLDRIIESKVLLLVSSIEQQQSKVTGSDPIALEIEIERERLEVLTTVEEKLNTGNLIALIASAINTAFVISVFLYQALEKPTVRLFQRFFPGYVDKARVQTAVNVFAGKGGGGNRLNSPGGPGGPGGGGGGSKGGGSSRKAITGTYDPLLGPRVNEAHGVRYDPYDPWNEVRRWKW